jgi:hypothetical protein
MRGYGAEVNLALALALAKALVPPSRSRSASPSWRRLSRRPRSNLPPRGAGAPSVRVPRTGRIPYALEAASFIVGVASLTHSSLNVVAIRIQEVRSIIAASARTGRSVVYPFMSEARFVKGNDSFS